MIKKFISAGAIVCVMLFATATAAFACVPPRLTVNGHGCESATITVSNPNDQDGVVNGGNLFTNGTQLKKGVTIHKDVTRSDVYTVRVYWTRDRVAQSSSITVKIPKCPPPTTVPTTSPPVTEPPTTDTTATDETVQKPPTGGTPVVTAATPVETTAAFTG